MIPNKIPLYKMILLGFVLIVLCGFLLQSASAYLVNYSVSPIANAQLTNTAASTVVGANISWLNMTTNQGATATISLTGTTLVVGATKVATVGLKQFNVSNISTMTRAWINFPIQLPANATVTNASLILYLVSKTTTFGAPDLIVTNATPLDPTNGIRSDYHTFINISEVPIYNQTPVTFQSWTAATRKVIYLNAAGRAAIEAARNYKDPGGNENNFVVGLRSEWDVTSNNRTMIWTQLTAQSAIYTLGSMQSVVHAQDPFLNITYSMPDTLNPVAQFSVNLTPMFEGTGAQFFSQANNTIPGSTKYSWNFTDGGTKGDSTLENPQFVYTTAGTYTVRFSVANPGVTDSITKTNYINVIVADATPTPCPMVTPCPELCDDYTTSLLHYEGADHSVDIVDENTANGWLLRDVGEITTVRKQFGVSSLGLADAGGYAETTSAPSATTAFGKDNWTWDTWIRYDDIDPATDHGIFSWGGYGSGYNSDMFYQRNIAGDGSYVFNIYNGIVTTGSYVYHNQAGEYNANRWYHLELSRNGTYINFSIDGDQKLWDHISGSFDENTDMGNPGNLTYGYENHDEYYLDGWLDETRLSLGTQRHGSDFSVETSAYAHDPCTSTPTGSCTASASVVADSEDDFDIIGIGLLVLVACVGVYWKFKR